MKDKKDEKAHPFPTDGMYVKARKSFLCLLLSRVRVIKISKFFPDKNR